MKQSITKEQWEELSNEQIDTLLESYSEDIVNGQTYTHIEREQDDYDEPIWKRTVPLLSIGQLIEFLRDDLKEINIQGNYIILKNYAKFSISSFNSLNNTLWEAVKYNLK